MPFTCHLLIGQNQRVGEGRPGQWGEARTVGRSPPSQPLLSACPPNDPQALISHQHSPNLLCCDSIFWKTWGLLISLGLRAPSATPSPSAAIIKVTGLLSLLEPEACLASVVAAEAC